jgi:hypothetical protein
MGRRRQGNSTPQKTNNSIEDFVVNEENEYQVPDSNRIVTNMTNEINGIHKKSLREEIMNEPTEIFIEKL